MCPIACPFLVLGDYGYKCKKFRLGLRSEGGVPVRLEACVDGGDN